MCGLGQTVMIEPTIDPSIDPTLGSQSPDILWTPQPASASSSTATGNVPSWVWIAGGAALLLFLFSGGGRRR
jgi:hypothetical protein